MVQRLLKYQRVSQNIICDKTAGPWTAVYYELGLPMFSSIDFNIIAFHKFKRMYFSPVPSLAARM
jgi:hypothetical protein